MATNIKKIYETYIDRIKDLLNLNPPELVAVDIGLTAVKVAEIIQPKPGKYRLVNYSQIPLPELALIDDEIQKEEEIIEALQSAFESSNIENRNIVMSIFGKNTIARRIQVAGGDRDELEDQVLWEAEQYIPFNIDESEISFDVVGENEGGGTDTVVAAATHDVINNFKELVERAGLKVKIIDLSALALANLCFALYEKEMKEDEDASWLVFDFGAQKATMLILRGGKFIFCREIGVGGVMLTEEIQRQMAVNYFEAEDLKITRDSAGNLPEDIVKIIQEVNSSFFAEVKKALDFYISASQDDMISYCLVTGGACLAEGFLDGLADVVGIEPAMINPFELIEVDKKNIPEDSLEDIAYFGAIVMGLGMRTLND